MVLLNGKVATVDPEKPQAQAIAVRGDIIAAVGAEEEIRPYIGPNTQVIDLAGHAGDTGIHRRPWPFYRTG